jgi:hypothetical protein
MQAINEARINVWKQQDDSFFDQALIDVDGVIVATTAECKEGMCEPSRHDQRSAIFLTLRRPTTF